MKSVLCRLRGGRGGGGDGDRERCSNTKKTRLSPTLLLKCNEQTKDKVSLLVVLRNRSKGESESASLVGRKWKCKRIQRIDFWAPSGGNSGVWINNMAVWQWWRYICDARVRQSGDGLQNQSEKERRRTTKKAIDEEYRGERRGRSRIKKKRRRREIYNEWDGFSAVAARLARSNSLLEQCWAKEIQAPAREASLSKEYPTAYSTGSLEKNKEEGSCKKKQQDRNCAAADTTQSSQCILQLGPLPGLFFFFRILLVLVFFFFFFIISLFQLRLVPSHISGFREESLPVLAHSLACLITSTASKETRSGVDKSITFNMSSNEW